MIRVNRQDPAHGGAEETEREHRRRTTMNKEHARSLKNIVINRSMQTRIGFYFIALSLALIGLMMMVMNSYFGDLRSLVANAPDLSLAIQNDVSGIIDRLIVIHTGFLFIALIFVSLYSLFISHRIAGPMYAILKYIEELKAGNYDNKRYLRAFDELAPVMQALQDLGDHLKNKR